MITISDLSTKTGLSTRIIRHYTLIGLLADHLIDGKAQARCYDKDALQTLKVIVSLRNLGFDLNEIGNLMGKKLISTIDFKVKVIHRSKDELLMELRNKKSDIDFTIKHLTKK